MKRGIKEAQVSVRIPAPMDLWLERHAGKGGTKADVVRKLIEAEIAREDAERLTAMFDAAAKEITREDRQDLDLLMGGFTGHE